MQSVAILQGKPSLAPASQSLGKLSTLILGRRGGNLTSLELLLLIGFCGSTGWLRLHELSWADVGLGELGACN
jgi:hypothetical protein